MPDKEWQQKKEELMKKVISRKPSIGKQNASSKGTANFRKKIPAECLTEIHNQILRNSHLPENGEWADFSHEQQTARNKKVLQTLHEFALDFEKRAGECFYLYSVYPGCGKSLLAKSVGRETLKYFTGIEFEKDPERYMRGIKPIYFHSMTPVFWLNLRDFIEDLLAGMNGDEERRRQSLLRENRLLSPGTKLIILDDVFTNTRNTSGRMSTLELKRLYHWTDHWLNQKNKPSIIFTSNYDYGELLTEDQSNPFYPDEDNMVTAQKTASRIAGLLDSKENLLVMDSGPRYDFRNRDY